VSGGLERGSQRRGRVIESQLREPAQRERPAQAGALLERLGVVGKRRTSGGELALLWQRRDVLGGLSARRTMCCERLALLEGGHDLVVDGDLARADEHEDLVLGLADLDGPADQLVESADNCFPVLDNPALAQRFMDDQLETEWPTVLTSIVRALNPLHDEIFQASPMDYYWSAYQTEWATDIVFKTPAALAEVYPVLVNHAMHHFKSPDVMRFLGKKAHGNFTGELTTSFKDRPEGVRVAEPLPTHVCRPYALVSETAGRASTALERGEEPVVLGQDRPGSSRHGVALRGTDDRLRGARRFITKPAAGHRRLGTS